MNPTFPVYSGSRVTVPGDSSTDSRKHDNPGPVGDSEPRSWKEFKTFDEVLKNKNEFNRSQSKKPGVGFLRLTI